MDLQAEIAHSDDVAYTETEAHYGFATDVVMFWAWWRQWKGWLNVSLKGLGTSYWRLGRLGLASEIRGKKDQLGPVSALAFRWLTLSVMVALRGLGLNRDFPASQNSFARR